MSSMYVAVNTVQFVNAEGDIVVVKARDVALGDTGLVASTDIPAEAVEDFISLGALRPATSADLADDIDDQAAAAEAAAAEAAAAEAAAAEAAAAEAAAAEAAAKKPGKPAKADPAADEKALLG